jgi:hypothetical protein
MRERTGAEPRPKNLEDAVRHSLKTFGIRLNRTGQDGFAQAVREALPAMH